MGILSAMRPGGDEPRSSAEAKQEVLRMLPAATTHPA
jgi:hypothetical protein